MAAMTDKNSARIPWRLVAWSVAGWWIAMATLIAGHVLLVFLYSVAIAPDLPPAEYTAFAERSGPWFSIVLGAPVFYWVGRILRRRVAPRERGVGLAAWALYSAFDLTIVLAVGSMTMLLTGQWLVSQAVKLVAIRFATRARS